ncbi:CBS domain-containing protein [Peribacillus frigoritolerans]|uniref:CBS domain-containing protein n=1 Tax=Peribacillus frigoritolerans TaxID=450367 RepID=UPI00105A763E|nr:CBS domain-containing protein [Peribacillus frigoritolerans]TDL78734.1 CBS domain-containing protein [Peribacillus frigoritolerans]
MNIAFFLIPKKEVVYLNIKATMRQALERMEYHRYSAVPLLDDERKYVTTLTEGDLLWMMKNTPDLHFYNTETIRLSELNYHRKNEPIPIHAEMEHIISRAMEQNFVPVTDDQGTFIGIIRRREIIEYCANQLFAVKRN